MTGIIGGLLIYGSALVASAPLIQVAHAAAPEPTPVEVLVSEIAEEYGIATSTLHNLVKSESQYDPLADNGYDRGLAQISRKWHPEVTDKCAFDSRCALRWTAQRIKDGYLYEWVAANCFSYASLFVKLPRMADIKPNTTPAVGRIAVFKYKSLKHIAVITKLNDKTFEVKESNYVAALIGTRSVSWDDPALLGFFEPSN